MKIKISFKLRNTATETYNMLNCVNGNEVLSHMPVLARFQRFTVGCKVMMIQGLGICEMPESGNCCKSL